MKTMHKLDYARNKTQKIINTFSCSFMSNTKWVKLIDALVAFDNISIKSKVKLIWDNELRDISINNSITYQFDYYHNAMESMISGYPKGWYNYKEIEWLELQADDNVISRLKHIIERIGQFEYTIYTDKIRLYCYK